VSEPIDSSAKEGKGPGRITTAREADVKGPLIATQAGILTR